MLSNDVLRLLRVEMFEIGLGNSSRAFSIDVAVYNSDGWLRQDGQRRVNQIDPIAEFFLQQMGFVFRLSKTSP